MDRLTGRQIDGQTDSLMDGRTERQVDRQTDDGQRDRQRNIQQKSVLTYVCLTLTWSQQQMDDRLAARPPIIVPV